MDGDVLDKRPGERLDPREGGAPGHVITLTGIVAGHRQLGHLLKGIYATVEMAFR